ncbi:MAG TPA: TRAFs-binding domain-containing protein [Pyrinomonadaceae bacterium]|nr:TRAFs-binding domain-containing protein [Pyrinomonadaceae bacterium]
MDITGTELPKHLQELVELLAENAYNVRARQRLAQKTAAKPEAGRKKGSGKALFPPYKELPESEKQDDRNTATETLKLILSRGYWLDRAKPGKKTDGHLARPQTTPVIDQINSASLSSLMGHWHAREIEEWGKTPELYRLVGRRILKLGQPLLAYDVLTEGLKTKPSDVEMRQQLALALARSGATQRGNSILSQLREEGHRDEETLGILARTHKDLWAHAATESEGKRQLQLAHKFYREAYKLSRGYYSGINAATLALLLGRNDEARKLALEVRQACLADLEKLPAKSGDRYWPMATLGEACLILHRWTEAQDWYGKAAEIARGNFADLSSTRRNARLILDHLGRDPAEIEKAFKIPSVIVFTGHLIDRPDRQTRRFPAQLEPAVRAAIHARLKKIDAGFGYASAACGSDIIFLETLLEAGGETNIVLPYESKQFIKDSVTVAPGNWTERFEKVLKNANSVIVASNERLEEGSMSFEYANLLLQGLADIRARQLETKLKPLAVWDGQEGDGPGGTSSTIASWEQAGLDYELIDLAKILKRELGSSPAVRQSAKSEQATRSRPRKKPSDALPTRIMAMLFADAVNFSKLTEPQIPRFLSHFLGAIGNLMAISQHAPLIKNTWGDGLYFVFDDVRDAGLFALELCQIMVDTDWSQKGLPKAINLRIALHAGPVYSCVDPVTGQQSYTGTHVSRAARIEPITPPGQVYSSQAFAALAAARGVKEFICDYVGQTPLAKGYGTFATYHVRGTQVSKNGGAN